MASQREHCPHRGQIHRAREGEVGERQRIVCLLCFRVVRYGVHPAAVQPELPFGRPVQRTGHQLTGHQLEHRRRMLEHLTRSTRA